MGRKAAREIAIKLLFQMEFQKENKEEQIEAVLSENKLTNNDYKYINDVIRGVFDKIDEIDVLIKKYAKGWDPGRMSKVDLSVLRLCIYEVLYREDIPYSVSVNEAVEIAKKFSSEEAGSFINGILSNISKQETNIPENN